jgi:hypothetical protein
MHAGDIPAHGAVLLALVVGAELLFGSVGGTQTPQQIIDDTISLAPASPVDTSLNWSGYVAGDGGYTAVSGSWIVPSVTDAAPLAADATWVGIGGTGNRDLIQAGTQAIVQNGSVEYQAWLEGLPGASVEMPVRVRPGDVVRASIEEVSSGRWRVTLQNETTGCSYDTTVAYGSVHTSAEWIEEMPSGSVLIPLDQFDSVHFLSASAVKDGKTVTPLAEQARPVTMVADDGSTLALPSVLSEKGDAFKVERSASAVLQANGVSDAQP